MLSPPFWCCCWTLAMCCGCLALGNPQGGQQDQAGPSTCSLTLVAIRWDVSNHSLSAVSGPEARVQLSLCAPHTS